MPVVTPTKHEKPGADENKCEMVGQTQVWRGLQLDAIKLVSAAGTVLVGLAAVMRVVTSARRRICTDSGAIGRAD
ncbi:hypothetical protein CX648_16895 [Aeromonas dhakensis]|nr:hypothetical protein CX648_16895 [Aeromonas dhakensis]